MKSNTHWTSIDGSISQRTQMTRVFFFLFSSKWKQFHNLLTGLRIPVVLQEVNKSLWYFGNLRSVLEWLEIVYTMAKVSNEYLQHLNHYLRLMWIHLKDQPVCITVFWNICKALVWWVEACVMSRVVTLYSFTINKMEQAEGVTQSYRIGSCQKQKRKPAASGSK